MDSESPTIVIYHGGGCRDGFCAAWLFSQAFPNAEFFPAQYGQAPPDVVGKNVFVADFCYKRHVMKKLAAECHGITVLDHHRTAEDELEGFADECETLSGFDIADVHFDMEKSGGRLAYEYLRGRGLLPYEFMMHCPVNADGPWIVRYTEDRDLWRHALPNSLAINAALRSFALDFEIWNGLHAIDPSAMAVPGNAILRAERQIVDQHVRHAFEIQIAGHVVPCVNATVLMSEIGHELSKGRPFAATYFDRQDGLRQWSLRSAKGGLDVSKIALILGGGGHANAAGFETEIDYMPRVQS